MPAVRIIITGAADFLLRYNPFMNMVRSYALRECVILLASGCLTLQCQDPVPSEKQAPALTTQSLILENEFVRVLDMHYPPGFNEAEHSHGRGVTVALSDYDNESKTVPEGKINKGHTKFGEVRWAEPVTHEAHNVGTTLQHVIRIELKGQPSGVVKNDPYDSMVVSKATHKVVLENRYVRVVEDHLPPSGTEPKHTHPHGVVIMMSDFDSETRTYPDISSKDGRISRNHYNKGLVRWAEPNVHDVKNVGATELYVIRIDLK